MKMKLLLAFIVVITLASCSKTNTPSAQDEGAAIIAKDSSQFNGRLYITTLDYFGGTKIANSDVYLYTNYEDIYRNLYLYNIIGNNGGEVDFGYLLQGNYYVVSSKGFKRDTSLVQILGGRSVQRNVYLR
ncbi:MAG: hypothetical protein SGJ00_04555 [bacterium]|nr:hypothetical protein [bacterium]